MSWQAKGLYRELLDEFWAEGFIPTNRDLLAEICGCTVAEFDQFWPEFGMCWVETEDGFVNRKMDEQRTSMDSLRVANARNGSAGANAKLATAKRPLASADDRQATASERHIEEKRREEKSKVPLASTADAVPAVVLGTLPLLGNKNFSIYRAQVADWQEAYPAVDVPQECREMRQWLIANPSNKKTAKGIRRFINSWLSRAQDRAPLVKVAKTATQAVDALAEIRRRNAEAEAQLGN